jgi:hypothetical protein
VQHLVARLDVLRQQALAALIELVALLLPVGVVEGLEVQESVSLHTPGNEIPRLTVQSGHSRWEVLGQALSGPSCFPPVNSIHRVSIHRS